jgi:Zn-dependent protease
MGFEDRDYYRESSNRSTLARVGQWILSGRVYLFEAFGIRVYALSWLIIAMAYALLFMGNGYVWQDRLIASLGLFVIVLLHEFGHCFGARYMGGQADEIVMHPLGGLALTAPPKRWWPHFVTTAAGPLVNVVICIVSGIVLYAYAGKLPWRPYYLEPFQKFGGWVDIAWWSYWIYQTSWTLLLFNLLPIFPLDGGRMVQEVAWKYVGYYRSMIFACTTGIAGAVVAMLVGLLTGTLGLTILALLGLMYCVQLRRAVMEAGPYAFDEENGPDLSAASESWKDFDTRERKERQRVNKRELKAQAKAEKEAAAREAERVANEAKLDQVLAKISSQGKDSLSRSERKFLEQMTEAKRKAKS